MHSSETLLIIAAGRRFDLKKMTLLKRIAAAKLARLKVTSSGIYIIFI